MKQQTPQMTAAEQRARAEAKDAFARGGGRLSGSGSDPQGLGREQLEDEVRKLRARLTALEQELVEVQARADSSVAHWQERAYWLERWHLDLNAVMRRRGALETLAFLKAIRSVFRALRRAKWRLLS